MVARTVYPFRARVRVARSPMPLEAPVTRATFGVFCGTGIWRGYRKRVILEM